MRRFSLALALASWAAGCGGQHPAPVYNATVTLGSANSDGTGFLPLQGDETLVPGAQGGFHVWLKWRISGMPPATVHVHRESHRVSDDALVLLADQNLDVGAASAAGYWELEKALPSFMCPTPIGVNVIDQPIVFSVTLTLDGKPLAASSAEATVHCPTDGAAAFCQKICSG